MAGGFFPAVDAKKSTIRTDAPATMRGHDFFILLLPDLELFQFIPQYPLADAELFRRAGLHPSGRLERIHDDAAFQGVEGVVNEPSRFATQIFSSLSVVLR